VLAAGWRVRGVKKLWGLLREDQLSKRCLAQPIDGLAVFYLDFLGGAEKFNRAPASAVGCGGRRARAHICRSAGLSRQFSRGAGQ
jgi:hypothetical protein